MQYTLTQGKVNAVDDPAKAGRLKIELQEVDGQVFPDWIDPIFPPGWIWLPEPGDTVGVLLPTGDDLIEFPEQTRWIGQVFDQDNPHPKDFEPNYPQMRGFKTKAGHVLIVDDKDKVISVTTPAKHQILLDEKQDKVSLRYKDTDVITINASGIFLGTESASEPFVLGTQWKTLMVSFLTAFLTHIHPTGVGPSGQPGGSAQSPNPTAAAASEADLVAVNALTHLSDFIKGQKVKP